MKNERKSRFKGFRKKSSSSKSESKSTETPTSKTKTEGAGSKAAIESNKQEKSAGNETLCVGQDKCIGESSSSSKQEKQSGNDEVKNRVKNKACTCKPKPFKCIRQIKLEEKLSQQAVCPESVECAAKKSSHPGYHKHRFRADLFSHIFSLSSITEGLDVKFSLEDPLICGMVSYAILWPLGCMVQDFLQNGFCLSNFNVCRALRYAIFGAVFMAPTLHMWIKLANRYIEDNGLEAIVIMALIEQLTYTPFASICFFFFMSLMEFKTVRESWNEVRVKFWPTFKASCLYWPIVQILNFYFLSPCLRVPFVCLCSFVWTIFMAYMKSRRVAAIQQQRRSHRQKRSHRKSRTRMS